MSSLGSYGRRLRGIDVFEYTSLNVANVFSRALDCGAIKINYADPVGMTALSIRAWYEISVPSNRVSLLEWSTIILDEHEFPLQRLTCPMKLDGWKMEFPFKDGPFQGGIPSATRMPEGLKMKTLAITDVVQALPFRQRVDLPLSCEVPHSIDTRAIDVLARGLETLYWLCIQLYPVWYQKLVWLVCRFLVVKWKCVSGAFCVTVGWGNTCWLIPLTFRLPYTSWTSRPRRLRMKVRQFNRTEE